MKRLKKVCATMLSALMLTGSIACGSVSAITDNNVSKVQNKTTQTLVYPKASDKKNKNYVEGEAVVMMKGSDLISSGASLDSIADVSSGIKVESVSDFKERKNSVSVVTVSSKKLSTEKIIQQLEGDDNVLIAEPNYIYKPSSLTDDTYSKFQWALENKGINDGKVGEDIKPTEMWNKESTGKDTPVVAVLDTGVDFNHEDLKDKMWVNPYQDKLKGVYGFDFTGTIDNNEPMDDVGHGTHCAGIIAAERNNKKGISGVVDNVKIMALKFMTIEGGTTENAVSAYNYIYNAMKLGVNVVAVNNSWGSDEDSKILTNAINKVGKAGAVSVCAAGNDGINFDAEEEYTDEFEEDDDLDDNENENVSVSYPACSESKYIISIAATGENGKIAAYSNYGKDTVDMAAPGSDILSSVNYNCFLPTIYNEKELKERCQQYITKDFNANLGVIGDKQGKNPVSITEPKTGYDDATGDNTCLQFDFTVDKDGYYALEIPYTASPEGDGSIHTSFMYNVLKTPETDSKSIFGLASIYFADFAKDESYTTKDIVAKNEIYSAMKSTDWVHIDTTNLTPEKATGERKLVIMLATNTYGDYSVRIDNIGFSKGIENEEENFGKYDIYSGTSMATPYVAGSIALIKDKYNDLTVDQLIEITKNTVNQNSLVDETTKSNGILSLDKYGSVIPKVDSWNVSGNKTIINGTGLDGVTKITVNDKEIKSFSINKDKITINDSNDSYFGGVCNLKVFSKDGYGYYSKVLLKGNRYTDNGLMDSETIYNYNLVSDGKYVYNLDDNYNIVRYSVNSKGVLGINKIVSYKGTLNKHFEDSTNGSSSFVTCSSPVYYNGKIYLVVDYFLTPEESMAYYMKKSAILTYDTTTCKYTVKDIDDIGLTNQTLAFYNKSMYLLGGYDDITGSLSNAVYKLSNSKWEKVASLPSKRAMGKCLQFGNKLVYTMGISESDRCPCNLIFDGKSWKESNKDIDLYKSQKIEIDRKIFNYYSCGVDFVQNGILFTGELFNNKGDTLLYNPDKDEFTVMNNYFHTDKLNGIKGAVVGNKFYGKGYTNTEAHTFSFNVKSGMKNVSVTSKYGKVTGGGYYMPNTVATITATPNKNFKFKSMVVNGKTYTKNKVQFTVTKDTKVVVNYISLVTSVKLNKTSLKLNKGKTYQLKATVTPTIATNKSVSWTTNKKSVATVTSKGKVKAINKGTAIIKATAKDGSKKSATCKVVVK